MKKQNVSLFHFGILNKFLFFAIMEKSGYFFEHSKRLQSLGIYPL